MRLLISIGMVIIFISAFFIIFTVDSIIRNDLNCLAGEEGKIVCNLENVGFTFIVKTVVIGFFILLDIVAVYLIVTNAMPGVYYLRRGEKEF
jgi:hypothetical protein